jgi:hypothetical protein
MTTLAYPTSNVVGHKRRQLRGEEHREVQTTTRGNDKVHCQKMSSYQANIEGLHDTKKI